MKNTAKLLIVFGLLACAPTFAGARFYVGIGGPVAYAPYSYRVAYAPPVVPAYYYARPAYPGPGHTWIDGSYYWGWRTLCVPAWILGSASICRSPLVRTPATMADAITTATGADKRCKPVSVTGIGNIARPSIPRPRFLLAASWYSKESPNFTKFGCAVPDTEGAQLAYPPACHTQPHGCAVIGTRGSDRHEKWRPRNRLHHQERRLESYH